MSLAETIIAANYANVQQRIEDAAAQAGRQAREITLVAVTKYVEIDLIRPLVDAGCVHIGESRPQAIWQRAKLLPNHLQWHLVGHLQRNKVARTLPLVHYVHSLDSLRLLAAVQSAIQESGRHDCRFLLEVNISAEAQKHGFQPEEMPQVLDALTDYPDVHVVGLMGMTAHDSTPEEARRQFASLRGLRDQLTSQAQRHVVLRELSMGMSGDFEIAIEEGATMVRVGSALFEGCVP